MAGVYIFPWRRVTADLVVFGSLKLLLLQAGGPWATSQLRIPSLVTCVNVSGFQLDGSVSDTVYLIPCIRDKLCRCFRRLPTRSGGSVSRRCR